MEFVKSLGMFHINAKEIPCVTGEGAPTEKTEGAPGALYMDTHTGELYKCRAADEENEVFIWEAQEGSGYILPVGGDRLGGVKNGGNVVINPDGTMSAPASGDFQYAGVEPVFGDIPRVFFGGPLQQTKTEAVVPFSYRSKTLSVDCYAEIKAQGNSTLSWPKKNQTVKLFRDAECSEKLKINFKGWGEQNKFVIKANWRDLTHVRDIVSVRLEGDCMRTNPDYEELPELLRSSPNLGGVDGFPVVVYADGVYQGRYMWNIPKDAWMANMDDELDTHCILCSEDYGSGCFRAAANINGSDWTDEVHDTVPASIKARWNEVISFVINSTDGEFVANLDSYIKVSTLIDRHLMGLLSCDFDGYGKNQLYLTYDGQQWYAGRYDKDGTWGNYWTGEAMLPAGYGREQYEDFVSAQSDGRGNLLFIRLEQLFRDRLQTRWAELRVGPLSVPNIISRFRELYDVAPPYLIAEDYADTTANGAFTGIPNKDICTIQQIQKFAVERHAWMDQYIAGLSGGVEPEEPDVPAVPDEPEGTVDVLWENYAPAGASFQKTVVVDWGSGYIEASMDLSSCVKANENILSIGNDIANWRMYGFHLNYTADTNTLEVNALMNPADGLSARCRMVLESDDLVLRVDGNGISVNGDLLTAADFNVNAVKQADYEALMKVLRNNKYIQIGSAEGSNRSNATYEYIRVVTNDASSGVLDSPVWSDAAEFGINAAGICIPGNAYYCGGYIAIPAGAGSVSVSNVNGGTYTWKEVAVYGENYGFVKKYCEAGEVGGNATSVNPTTVNLSSLSGAKYIRATAYPNNVAANNDPNNQLEIKFA